MEDEYAVLIIGKNDTPLFEADLSTRRRNDAASVERFLLYTALDTLEQQAWKNNSTLLKPVEVSPALSVSSLISPGHVKILLLHRSTISRSTEEAIRAFLMALHELYAKALLSPFSEISRPIVSPAFEERLMMTARRLLLKQPTEVA